MKKNFKATPIPNLIGLELAIAQARAIARTLGKSKLAFQMTPTWEYEEDFLAILAAAETLALTIYLRERQEAPTEESEEDADWVAVVCIDKSGTLYLFDPSVSEALDLLSDDLIEGRQIGLKHRIQALFDSLPDVPDEPAVASPEPTQERWRSVAGTALGVINDYLTDAHDAGALVEGFSYAKGELELALNGKYGE